MLDEVRSRWRALVSRARRVERREVREFRAWLENTRNLIHVSLLVVLPAVLGFVTLVSNVISQLPFLLFPPLASGSYTLFAHPESKYASPRRFVGGLTAGAFCGWLALEASARYWYQVQPDAFSVHAGAVALGIFLTGALTWALDIEEASAYASALLVHLVDVTNTTPVAFTITPGLRLVVGPRSLYVVSVFVSTSLVAAVFLVWRSRFYEQRARYLYASIEGDDRVLVPMRGDHRDATAMLGARLAAAHDAGKVVLLDIVGDEAVARAERALVEEGDRASTADVDPDDQDDAPTPAEERAVAEAATDLEERADHIQTDVGVPCQVVVAVDDADRAATVLQTAREANCDLVVAPYEERHGRLSSFVRELFRDVDVLVHRSADGHTSWKRVLVPVRRAGDVAHAMIDFGRRLGGSTGRVTVCHCLGGWGGLRQAEEMLADLVETFSGDVETRVSRSTIEEFLADNAPQFDLTILGASMDRTAASRFVSPPTFERIEELDCDVAILHRAR